MSLSLSLYFICLSDETDEALSWFKKGTGWEAKYMQKKNSSAMFKAAAHAFSTEDM